MTIHPPKTSSSQPLISLNGVWKFHPHAPTEFWKHDYDASDWREVVVPGEPILQGFDVATDRPCAYRREIAIPYDWNGKSIVLRFHGAHNAARVWVNGIFVREHFGSAVSWDCDLTNVVQPGRTASLAVELTDRSDDPSHISRHCRRCVVGLLRKVELMAFSPTHLTRMQIDATPDDTLASGTLRVGLAVRLADGEDATTVRLSLTDPAGLIVPLEAAAVRLTRDTPEVVRSFAVRPVATWDAEHPLLYRLRAEVLRGETVESVLERDVGFRSLQWNRQPQPADPLKRVGSDYLRVNGRTVKLRGMNRAYSHPLLGNALTKDVEERDVRLLREANVNFIRTAHAPPTEEFLELCDRLGMYVEVEAPVSFAAKASTDDPAMRARYLDPLAAMIERDRDHPSVIIWSLGNESDWGVNIPAMLAYVRREDDGRPNVFSWGTDYTDLRSSHYPGWNAVGSFNDEFGLPPSGLTTPVEAHMRLDPGIADFWGESIARFWETMFRGRSIGGAIWASPDQLIQSPIRNGRTLTMKAAWGIYDGWRRPKAQYFHTRKAYSPVRIAARRMDCPVAMQPLRVPVSNWFDHTNFDELIVRWRVGEESGTIAGPHLEPHTDGELAVPGQNWRHGEVLRLEFVLPDGRVVDEFDIAIGDTTASVAPHPPAEPPRLLRDASAVKIIGREFDIEIDPSTGRMRQARHKDVMVLMDGPVLNMAPRALEDWTLKRFQTVSLRIGKRWCRGPCDRHAWRDRFGIHDAGRRQRPVESGFSTRSAAIQNCFIRSGIEFSRRFRSGSADMGA